MRLVSILGDSISTFEGYNPPGYSVFYDKEMKEKNGLISVYDTWWAKVIQAFHAYLCMNNSYSGSRVSGDAFPAASSMERTCSLGNGGAYPDIVLVYIGYNDFGNGVRINRESPAELDLFSFEDAYRLMLTRIKANYPSTRIICGTLMRTSVKGHQDWTFPESYKGVAFELYNDVIRKIVSECGFDIADLAGKGVSYETLDGSHPTSVGHITLANAWIEALDGLGLVDPI